MHAGVETTATATRPRALTIPTSSEVIQPSNTFYNETKHSRAVSELSGSAPRSTLSKSLAMKALDPETIAPYDCIQSVAECNPTHDYHKVLAYTSLSPTTDVEVIPKPLSDHPLDDSGLLQVYDVSHRNNVSTTNSPTTVSISVLDTGFSMEHDVNDIQAESLSATAISPFKDSKDCETNYAEAGLSFEQLVDRLLSPAMSKADVKFIAVFLCLYRKFATPGELLSTITDRWEAVEKNGGPNIAYIGSQLRYLGVLAQWLSIYPGDFASPSTRHHMSQFIGHLGKTRVYAVAAKEMALQLDYVADDDDTHWASSDEYRGTAATPKTVSRISTVSDNDTPPPKNMTVPRDDKGNDTKCHDSELENRYRTPQHSKSPSISSTCRPNTSQSDSSLSILPNSVEVARRLSQLLVPVARNPLTKVQWHQFMEIPNEDVAQELTRIDWTMFTSIQPRDLIRHVSLQADRRVAYRNLEHVDRMIHQFQHLAFWVANMILLRDKSKHRAKVLEKFMSLAWVGCYVSIDIYSLKIRNLTTHRNYAK